MKGGNLLNLRIMQGLTIIYKYDFLEKYSTP